MNDELAARLERLMARYGIAELEIEEGDLHLRLGRRPIAQPVIANIPAGIPTSLLRATVFGTLRLTHPASAGSMAQVSAASKALEDAMREAEAVLAKVNGVNAALRASGLTITVPQ